MDIFCAYCGKHEEDPEAHVCGQDTPTERMTREQAVERVGPLRGSNIKHGHTRWCDQEGCEHLRLADLLMAVQAETERRVTEKCCEIAESIAAGCDESSEAALAWLVHDAIRSAFPQEGV